MSYANHVAMHQAFDAVPIIAARNLMRSCVPVLMVIATHAGKADQTCWLSYETIARESYVSRSTAFRSIQELADAGLIQVKGRHKGGVNHYRFSAAEVVSQGDGSVSLTTPSVSLTIVEPEEGSVSLTTPSVSVTLPQCQPDHWVVSARPLGSVSLTPEVVHEIDPDEVVQEVEQRSSAGAVCSALALPSVSVQQEETDTPAQTSAPAPVPSSPERQLTQMYFDHLGKPKAYKTGDHIATWDAHFRKLLTKYSLADLIGAIEWAWTIDDFWPTRLNGNSDPVEYFVAKADTILKQYLGQRAASQKKATKAATPVNAPVPAVRPALLRLFKSSGKRTETNHVN